MKYSLTLVSVVGLNLGFTLAQDAAQMLTAVGFPACAVPCILQGNKAATDKHGCAPTDAVCQCTTAYKTVQETIMTCVMSTKPCNDADMAKLGQAGAQLCASAVKGAATGKPASGAAAPASTPNNASTGHTSSTDSSHSGAVNGTAGAGSSGSGSSGTATSGSGTPAGSATKPSTAVTSAPGAKAASGPSNTAGVARPEKIFVAGALGLVGAVIALAV
ncbi:hypothetical protein E2P81_ATG04449 [Venturia nashicola]|nr:hypothetical protein E2P81_ATG04449 [Venturia nashicola]